MSLARRYSDPTYGDAQPAPAVSPLGIPELRSRQHAARARRRERRVRLVHCATYAGCLLLGILTGLWAAGMLAAHQSHAPAPPSALAASDHVQVSVRTLSLAK